MLLASITHSITSSIGDHGLYAVFVLMADRCGFPAASELVMIYGGALAAGAIPGSHVVLFGHPIDSPSGGYVAVSLAGTLGYLLGSIVGWAIGAYGGRPLLERHGRWLHLTPENFARAEEWFDRRGDAAVFLGRVTPLVRSFISIPAGVFRSPFGRYTVLTLVGSAIWCFAFAGDRLGCRNRLPTGTRGFPLGGLRCRRRGLPRRGLAPVPPTSRGDAPGADDSAR